MEKSIIFVVNLDSRTKLYAHEKFAKCIPRDGYCPICPVGIKPISKILRYFRYLF
jgi:hypothetical protein